MQGTKPFVPAFSCLFWYETKQPKLPSTKKEVFLITFHLGGGPKGVPPSETEPLNETDVAHSSCNIINIQLTQIKSKSHR